MEPINVMNASMYYVVFCVLVNVYLKCGKFQVN
jgi:hypothetical protein